ncbi:hypothetical protein AV521_33790 [Streptomyces sp. IMTB 2501]|uniref:hypothetical protein n=1 Tax=Streptomyces sp. IMTB 2501 TaxID=1776340 RepID=UPI00096E63C9|nr:hypothetical protein [Streptomyces sp. IMTB 2501]OLZ64929.1 hypothetical protein AV521_33790 [Streptomyces sp. IMTB 2501]
MATKTEEGAEAGTTAGIETHNDDETRAKTGTAGETARAEETKTTAAADEVDEAEGAEDSEGLDAEEGADDGDAKVPSGVGQGAGAVVSAALGLVSLSGGWIGTIAGAREQLVGQLRTPSTAGVATQIKAVYGNAWHSTALWAGLFALAALLTGVVVLARPAFGVPGRPQAPWIKSVAWAGVCLGVIGLLLAVLKYSDALLGLPSTG